jgi:DNA-binding response OmpR family regulator
VKKVLVIEDDVDTLDLMELILNTAGYAVIKANREVTIKEIAGIKPDLVILDYLLPYGLGTEKCFEIKNNPLTAETHVILYSASPGFEKEALQSKADAYIAKPFDVDKLLELVDKTID